MEIQMEIIIRAMLVSWWLINFGPSKSILEKIKAKVPAKLTYLKTAVTCFVCQSFWFTLLFGAISKEFLFFDAIMAAVIAYTYDKFINSLKQYF